MRKIYIILILFSITGLARGQEINFSRVQDMTIWYNQSLKTDKQNSLKLNYRSVRYGGQIAYNSVAALFDMPLLSKEGKNKPNSGYFSVYNRWGNLIYTTQDANQGWDGTFKGVAQPVETYLWIAEGIDVTGKKIVQKGMTSLVR